MKNGKISPNIGPIDPMIGIIRKEKCLIFRSGQWTVLGNSYRATSGMKNAFVVSGSRT